jgi:hypothetical protein
MRGRSLIARLLAVCFLVATVYLYKARNPGAETLPPSSAPAPAPAPATAAAPAQSSSAPAGDGGAVLDAFRERRSGVEVEATGVVTRSLPDDLEGSKHQRFILRVGDQTVLVAHNIDLAPRVPVSEGDTVQLRGEYEWNQLGGVIHWTHRDPAGRHPPGWIRIRGRLYQ